MLGLEKPPGSCLDSGKGHREQAWAGNRGPRELGAEVPQPVTSCEGGASSSCLAQVTPGPSSGAKMPALHIEDLPEKEKLKMEVEQLRKEVKLQRQQVSKCSEEIKNYIEERAGEDPLVKGIPEDKNPFKEKGSCVIS
ncbi:hypothetical protein U0070_018671 [Myodes glareolus]|uniref:Guanine nucleotide-binding protein subunit gamma n=2 Tax=Myodes glareolus TaxID=447135 RepID=A0AAW0IVI6_MYOGA